MFNAALQGIVPGLILAISMGPAFFSLIHTSIKHGFRSGVYFATGVVSSDALFILIAYFGASRLFDDPARMQMVGTVGGLILIIYGLYSFFQKQSIRKGREIKIQYVKPFVVITKGFFLNIFNPFILIFWFGLMSAMGSKFEFNKYYMAVFFATTLATVFITDVLKSIGAYKIKSFLRPKSFIMINKAAGIILVIFGITLIVRVLTESHATY